jgi:hypothetical protein
MQPLPQLLLLLLLLLCEALALLLLLLHIKSLPLLQRFVYTVLYVTCGNRSI